MGPSLGKLLDHLFRTLWSETPGSHSSQAWFQSDMGHESEHDQQQKGSYKSDKFDPA